MFEVGDFVRRTGPDNDDVKRGFEYLVREVLGKNAIYVVGSNRAYVADYFELVTAKVRRFVAAGVPLAQVQKTSAAFDNLDDALNSNAAPELYVYELVPVARVFSERKMERFE